MTRHTPRPGRTSTKLSRGIYARVSPELHRQLRVRAAEEERSMAELIVAGIKIYLKQSGGAAKRLHADD